MIALLLTTLSSFALDGEVSLQTGNFGVGDADFELFARDRAVPGSGARFAARVADHVEVTAAYRYGARGSGVSVFENDWDTSNVFVAAFRLHEARFGARFVTEPTEVVMPYVLVEGLGLHGTALFDSDPSRDDNPGQVKRSGVTGGAAALLGCDVHAKQGGAKFAPAAHLEIGYAWAAPLALDDLGSIGMHGAVARLGAGVRF